MHIDFISGLTTTETGMVMLLDADRLLSVEEIFALEAVQQAERPPQTTRSRTGTLIRLRLGSDQNLNRKADS